MQFKTFLYTGFLFLVWIVPGLFANDPWKPDEAYTFGLVLEYLDGAHWLTPVLAGEPFMEKPPLFFLTAAGFAHLLRDVLPLHEGASFANLLYVGLACLFTGLAARERYGGGAAACAVALLCGSVGLLLPAHLLITDMAKLTGTAIAAYGLVALDRRPRIAGIALGTGVGIAFMAKGLLLLGVSGIVVALLPMIDPARRNRQYAGALAFAALALLPWLLVWPVLLYRHAPELFDVWFWDNQVGRFLGSNTLGPATKPLHYLAILPWLAWPTLPLAAYAVWTSRRTLRHDSATLALLTLTIVLFAVLSVSRTARQIYALPLLVPLAIVAVPAVRALPARWADRWHRAQGVIFAVLLSALWLVGTALHAGVPTHLQERLLALRPGYEPHLAAWTLAVAVAYTLGWIILQRRLRMHPERVAYGWVTGLVAAWGVGVCFLLGWVDAGKTYRPVMTAIARQMPPTAHCLASSDLGEPQRAMLHYFGGLRTRRLEVDPHALECDIVLVQFRRGEAAWRPDGRWEEIWDGGRSGRSDDVFVLFQRLP